MPSLTDGTAAALRCRWPSLTALALLGALVSCGGALADDTSDGRGGENGTGNDARAGRCVAPDARSKALVLDGVCRIITTLVDQQMIGTFELDGSFLYWTNTYEGTIERMPVGGGAATTLVRDLNRPVGVAVDRSLLFFTEFGSLSRMPTYDDGSVRSFVLDDGPSTSVAAMQPGARAVVADDDNVYWLTASALMKASRSGGTPTALAFTTLPSHLVIDQGSLYWRSLEGALMKVATSGGDPIVLRQLARAPAGSFTVRNGRVYAGTDTRVLSIPLNGEPAQVLATEPKEAPIHAVTADDDYVYWASGNLDPDIDGGGTIKRSPLAGGPTTTIVAKLGFRHDGSSKVFMRLRTDATHLYFHYLTGYSHHDRLYRVNK